MVKQRKNSIRKNLAGKGSGKNRDRARKINAQTPYETCTEQLSPFGGLLAVIKFFDLVEFKQIFSSIYIAPSRTPKLGHYFMITGILMLLFIGFNRLWHFLYIRLDAMLCGFFRTAKLPVASTFWRYLDSLGINQATSLLRLMAALRERCWQLCGFEYARIGVDIDTTVETIYGNQQGGRKGHNTKNRGKKAYRPLLVFITQTREYLLGKLRVGSSVSGAECAKLIGSINDQLPGCVEHVLLRADGEFLSWDAVRASIEAGFEFIIANKGCDPVFDSNSWYRPRKRSVTEYNSCLYQPLGWETPCRFVVMRIPIEEEAAPAVQVQCHLFEEDRYKYRIFCTNLSGKAHKIIKEYDKRADVENLVGEAKREGLDAIPSSRFKNNMAFFQIVMLAYNIWRYLKWMADPAQSFEDCECGANQGFSGIANNTIRIARLKMLMIAGKVVRAGNIDKVKYSSHDSRTLSFIKFLQKLDANRNRERPWNQNPPWQVRCQI